MRAARRRVFSDTNDGLVMFGTPLLFVGGGVWVLWEWLSHPNDKFWFLIALSLALAAAAAVFVYVAFFQKRTATPSPRWLVPSLATAGLLVALTRLLPRVVLVALVAASCGLFLGMWAVRVWEAVRQTSREQEPPGESANEFPLG